jgi:hypothetical protein
MELVSISSVQPGRVIARAITGAEGVVLCPQGLRLTETAIERLKRMGVESVVLELHGGAQARLQQRIAELEQRFTAVDDPLLLQIKALIEARLQNMVMAVQE